MLFDIERELSKRVDSGTLNYCIPRFLGFEGLKRLKSPMEKDFSSILLNSMPAPSGEFLNIR